MTIPCFSVTKSDGELIRPYKETPSGTLPLSTIDKIYITGLLIESLYVFNNGRDPAKVIRHALSKALVPYYPMAGRLLKSGGELQVSCTGDGVWFVEASADCSLQDVNWLQHPPLIIPKDQLLPYHPDPATMILLFQVTQFSCGGFVVGMMSDHTIADGIGIANILNAIADLARGSSDPMITPVWYREAIPSPPKGLLTVPPPPLPPANSGQIQYFSIDVSLDCIARLKNHYHLHTGGRHCSTFDVLCAKIWQCRAQAMNMDPGAQVRLVFAANIRHLVKDLPPSSGGGYYGNCVYPVTVTAASGEIASASTEEIVGMIRDAKARLPTEYERWARGELTEDPFLPGYSFECIYMADWTRFGLLEVDYGWGKPAYIVPVIDSVASAVGFIAKLSGAEQGVRLITQCVMKHQLKEFKEKMDKICSIDGC